MQSRGTDDAGFWSQDDSRIALAHRRLSIIDPGADGYQPMATVDGRLRIVLNGEIYNYLPENSHVIPALIQRFHEAKEYKKDKVVIWGTGTPRREFLYVDDMAEASIYVMGLDKSKYDTNTNTMQRHLNVGTGADVTICELAELIGKVLGYTGKIVFDASKLDGAPRKLLDVSRMTNLGWSARIGLEEGLRQSFQDYQVEQREL